MSDEIYSGDKGIAIPVPQLQLDLKNNEFQMGKSSVHDHAHAQICLLKLPQPMLLPVIISSRATTSSPPRLHETKTLYL